MNPATYMITWSHVTAYKMKPLLPSGGLHRLPAILIQNYFTNEFQILGILRRYLISNKSLPTENERH